MFIVVQTQGSCNINLPLHLKTGLSQTLSQPTVSYNVVSIAAIWMLPYRNAYGKWPASGEIDIVESRGM